jgi:hypothetical protein
VPRKNLAEARTAATRIKLVPIERFQDALRYLRDTSGAAGNPGP